MLVMELSTSISLTPPSSFPVMAAGEKGNARGYGCRYCVTSVLEGCCWYRYKPIDGSYGSGQRVVLTVHSNGFLIVFLSSIGMVVASARKRVGGEPNTRAIAQTPDHNFIGTVRERPKQLTVVLKRTCYNRRTGSSVERNERS